MWAATSCTVHRPVATAVGSGVAATRRDTCSIAPFSCAAMRDASAGMAPPQYSDAGVWHYSGAGVKSGCDRRVAHHLIRRARPARVAAVDRIRTDPAGPAQPGLLLAQRGERA